MEGTWNNLWNVKPAETSAGECSVFVATILKLYQRVNSKCAFCPTVSVYSTVRNENKNVLKQQADVIYFNLSVAMLIYNMMCLP